MIRKKQKYSVQCVPHVTWQKIKQQSHKNAQQTLLFLFQKKKKNKKKSVGDVGPTLISSGSYIYENEDSRVGDFIFCAGTTGRMPEIQNQSNSSAL